MAWPASAFDTLQAAKQLEGCGFKREQAEAVAAVVQSVQGDLATKADLTATEAALSASFKAEVAKLRADVLGSITMRAPTIAGLAAAAFIGLNTAIRFFLLRLFVDEG